MGTKITGLRETVRDLERVGVELADLTAALGRIAARAPAVMQGFIPSRSGKLRASARGNRAKGKAVVTIGRASVRYAAPINYGWPARNIAPANFTGKTDAVMDGIAPDLLDQEIDHLLTTRGLK